MGSLISTLPGLYDGHLAVSYGYGAALVLQVACFLPPPRGRLRILFATSRVCSVRHQGLHIPTRSRPRSGHIEKALAPARARQEAG